MAKDLPLWHRLYTQPPLYELARLIGYAGLPVPEAQEQLKPLVAQYGKEPLARASEEIVHIDASTTPPTARLKPEARKLCFQLLGPPPEQAEQFHRGAIAPPPLSTAEPTPAPTKRRRKKEGTIAAEDTPGRPQP